MVNVAVSPVAPNANVEKHNPIGKIPALSVKGMDLFDSPVICEYLDSLHKGRKLLPRKGRERWVALRLQAMADGLLDAAILTRYEGALRPKDKRWPDWIKGQTKKIEGVLAQLEAEAKSLKGQPTIGTISVACLSSEPKCNTPADLIIGTVDQDLRECCHAMLFAFVG
jgi:glutathione S-transferase